MNHAQLQQISSSVGLEIRGRVALLIVDNPPVNVLSYHVRLGLLDGIRAAEASETDAIVLICRGRTFIAGADVRESSVEMMNKGPIVWLVQSAMEACNKPVIAAIHGTALGGGLEVALCAHYRVALSSAQFGLPEVNLGRVPGGGGPQRLMRITGAEKALEVVVGGERMDADEALACGLIDAIVDDLEADAIVFAERIVAEDRPLVRIRDRNDKLEGTDPAIFYEMRKKIESRTRGFLAPEQNIKAIEEAVTLDFDAGLARGRELADELRGGLQQRAQQYYFFAERAASKVPGIGKEIPVIDIQSCGVLGAGTMGGGIAMNFVNIGIPVTIVERDQAVLDRGLAVIRKNYERFAKRGQLSPGDVQKRMSLLTGSLARTDLGQTDIVIEAVFEDMGVKKEVFADLDKICKPGAILASNTSALDLNEIASATKRPDNVVGAHFFSPANVMKLLEIVRGDATSDSVIASTMALAKRIGKIPVLSGVCDGFIGNRMYFKYADEANQIILEGATPAQVDRVLYDFGLPMGPFALWDMAGLDIGWNEETSSSSTVAELLCESGRRGQKNGRGYFTYDPETRASTPDPEVEQLIRDFAAEKGIEQRDISDQEVLERCIYPMVNEAAKILEEGIALRGSDIDVVWVNGFGWPVYTGGPMFWADSVGLSKIADAIEQYSQTLNGDHWQLSPLLRQLANEHCALHEYVTAK